MQEPIPAKLVVISGVLTGHVFPLDGGEMTFGRDSNNNIGIPDASLSRQHCAFSLEQDGWRVRDVGSSNGTFVNGRQIENHLLLEGDRIAAGANLLLYVRDSAADRPAVDLDEDHPLPVTKRLAPGDAAYLLPRGVAARTHHPSEEGLKALLAISTAIHAIREEEALHRALLELLFEAVPAAEGAIIQPGADDALLIQAIRPVREGRFHVDAAAVRRAIQEGIGIVCADSTASAAPATPRLSSSSASRSLMAVPMAVHGRVVGAIYLAARPGEAFTDDHLQLATAVGRIAAIAIDNIRQLAALERETDRLQADLHLVHRMIGVSEPLRQVYERIGKVARVDTTILITGETGTGKEMAARAIHLNSPRGRRPFIAINCAALTESLLESELFGHERGAFTGAVVQKKGKLELANGGTVFLDEIGELAPSLQSKLLRVLQERELERIGGTQTIKVDLRILSATNRDLNAAVASGMFRPDLYFRLNVVSIHLPPLRARREDVPLLAEHFLAVYGRKAGRRLTSISPAAMQCLLSYDWPGNVRELENAIEGACVLGSGETILPEDLPESVKESAPKGQSDDAVGDLQRCVVDAKRRAIVAAFRRAGGSYVETARLLGVHPNYLHRLIRNLEIKPVLEGTDA
jgi:transcriptional regulator with GAF, ATPase, and Fis domain